MMRTTASQRLWLLLTACLGCLLCLHGFLQIQEPATETRHQPPHQAPHSILAWTQVSLGDAKLPVAPSSQLLPRHTTKDTTFQLRTDTGAVQPTSSPQLKVDLNGSIYSFCPNIRKPSHVQETQTFQPVLQGKSWVFSAYYDARLSKHVVKIIGIADVRLDSKPHFCRIWYYHTSEPDVRTVVEDIVPETHDKRFAVFIYTCHLRRNIAPYAVSLVRDRCDTPNILPVINNYKQNRGPTSKFTVCGPILHENYNNHHELVEMVETNALFGADHYVFYNYSTGAEIQSYLRKYKKEGLIDVIEWPLPLDLVDSRSHHHAIHYFGQLASLNDCLYRNLHKAKFIAVLDLDELLVPKSFNNWTAVMSSLPKQPHPQICSAVFRNTFFRTDLEQPRVLGDTETSVAKDLGIKSLVTTVREEAIWSHGLRSKYIADTSRLEMAGIHLPWKCIRERYNYDVSTSVALLHHYRNWSGHSAPETVQDNSILRYREAILQRIFNRHGKFHSFL